ncbi:hypothetical protein NLI96_g10918 [Meripilus lineatus]|uniref:Uncharacterized protein n=1 Tax=Meripilus lineatus TaxID=2056292 RepID=A0AAD5YDW2_9APHY|nr:hypothetical protein NLI96_g10918 [Physisporinus lineatus]
MGDDRLTASLKYVSGWYGAAQPPQQVVYVEKNKDKKDKDKKYKGGGGGMGMGTVLAAGGAGLVGGMLLENALDDHNDYEREMGYQEGFQDGADFGDGGDW